MSFPKSKKTPKEEIEQLLLDLKKDVSDLKKAIEDLRSSVQKLQRNK